MIFIQALANLGFFSAAGLVCLLCCGRVTTQADKDRESIKRTLQENKNILLANNNNFAHLAEEIRKIDTKLQETANKVTSLQEAFREQGVVTQQPLPPPYNSHEFVPRDPGESVSVMSLH
ncbi:hypothetical protein RLOatenuis_5920 [Rickettsiales bacterium]|nr:hypothetical protein RLOatenuis_5920 [Rickettsiales bacterium]